MKRKRKLQPKLSDLIPDPEKRKKVEEALYSDSPLLGPGWSIHRHTSKSGQCQSGRRTRCTFALRETLGRI